ncbi:MAG: DUF86 domain-containing protein [Candidatus Helarchaeota archaeon]
MSLKKNGIFYNLHTSIEAILDLIAISLKDLGTPVKDDISNIYQITKIRNIDPNLGEQLRKANGLRNILVHRYNKVDDEIILSSIPKLKKSLFKWLDIIEAILNELSKP